MNNTLQSGTILRGKSYTYTIQKVLGQGTFGITYLATTQVKVHGALGELETTMQVAVKEFFMKEINGREENTVTSGSQGGVYDKYKQKFAREAENLSKLKHPHIVKVLEYFEANNTVYYAMEYVEGGNLDDCIKQKNALPEAEAIKYAKQIGSALSYMHAHKMLHLDLKPGNVMLRKNGDAVLIDFGLSKQYDEEGKPETSTSVGGGTPGYAPIEQANYHDRKGFPVTMDVYALGATLFKMLTGVRPPEASDILNDGFPVYELQQHRVSDSLIACVTQAMKPMRKDRLQSVEEFLGMLGEETSWDDVLVDPPFSPSFRDRVVAFLKSRVLGRIVWGACVFFLLFTFGRMLAFESDYNSPFYPHLLEFVAIILSTLLAIAVVWRVKKKWPKFVLLAVTLASAGCAIFVYSVEDYLAYKGNGYWGYDGLFYTTDDIYLMKYPYNVLPVSRWGKWGLVDGLTGKMIVPYQYDYIHIDEYKGEVSGLDEVSNLYEVKDAGKYGLLNAKGEFVLPLVYDFINCSYYGGYYTIVQDGLHGLADVKGKIIIPPTYEDSQYDGFQQGLWAVKSNGKWGFVDKDNQVIIPFQYKYVHSFSGVGTAWVTSFDGSDYRIDRKGNILGVAHQK